MNKTKIAQTCETLAPVGLVAVAAATLMPLFAGRFDLQGPMRWIYGAGALWMLLARLFSPYRGSDVRMRRMVRMQAWSALFFVAATAMLFIPDTAPRDWLALTMAGAAVQVIASIMIGRRAAQLAKKK